MRSARYLLGEREESAVNRIMTLINGGKAMKKTEPQKEADNNKTMLARDSALKAARKKPNTCVVIDFSKIPGGLLMLDNIKKESAFNFRDPDKQILFMLKQAGGV